jgi:superfamily II DNA or RNA helicase
MEKGYIYLRDNAWYRSENTIKLGIASNTKDRDGTYVTGEIIRGEFIKVFEVPRDKMRYVETHLHTTLKEYRDRRDGGTEFFKRDIIDMVGKNIIDTQFRELSREECDLLERVARIRNTMRNHIDYGKQQTQEDQTILSADQTILSADQTILSADQTILSADQTIIEPKDFQKEIIAKCITHYSKASKDKGVLILTCGVGKTLISLWVAQQMDSNKIAIGVPTIVLLEQWVPIIAQIFPNRPILQVPCNEDVARFVSKHPKCVVITTYASSHKLVGSAFDMKILDEVHHLTCKNTDESSARAFVRMMDVASLKQLALTATPKHLEGGVGSNMMISNDNIELFGEVIHRICLLEAIEKEIVCDYVIQTVLVDEETIKESTIDDKHLFLSAYCALKSILDGTSHHLLIYCNDMNNSNLILTHVNALLLKEFSSINNCFANTYNSKMDPEEQANILARFETSQFGIIICVYCLGEGWNCPLLDAVVFAENMTSNIRILQCALRACRKDRSRPEKIAKIIIPILDIEKDDVKEVIYQMGLEDVTVISKLKVYTNKRRVSVSSSSLHRVDEVFVYDEDLTKRLRLKTMSRTELSPKRDVVRETELTITPISAARDRSSALDHYNELAENHVWKWNDGKHKSSAVGDGFAFFFYKQKLVFHRILDIKGPEHRLPSWGESTRNVVILTPPLFEIPWDEWISLNGYTRCMGTFTTVNLKTKRPLLFNMLITKLSYNNVGVFRDPSY